jgi:hypothetical protein
LSGVDSLRPPNGRVDEGKITEVVGRTLG